jgi:hypothetical protein
MVHLLSVPSSYYVSGVHLKIPLKYLPYTILSRVLGSGLDDWSYWHLLLQSLLITINYSSSQFMPAKTCSIPYWTTRFISSTVTELVLIYESATSSTNDLRITKDEWRTNTHLWINNLSLLYNFGANRIQITISNSSSYYSVLIRCCGNSC